MMFINMLIKYSKLLILTKMTSNEFEYLILFNSIEHNEFSVFIKESDEI